MPALTSMHSSTTNDWAEGLHLTVTGLTKDQRQQVRDVVEAAGGRCVLFVSRLSRSQCNWLLGHQLEATDPAGTPQTSASGALT